MLPDLSQESLVVILVLGMLVAVMRAVLLKLFGAIFTLKFVALTGGTEESDSGQQQRKAFHCGVL